MSGKEIEIFRKYLPEKSVDYCHQLWKDHRVQFTIARPRKTLYGNYMYRHGIHHISVNGDLNPESFLVTYLHEMAHLLVRKAAQKRVKPHGPEWQEAFRMIMKPMLDGNVFHDELSNALFLHLRKPTATSCADPLIHRLLQGNNAEPFRPDETEVQDLIAGDRFYFRQRLFRVIRRVRTRIECIREMDGAIYRFQPTARVRRETSTAGPT